MGVLGSELAAPRNATKCILIAGVFLLDCQVEGKRLAPFIGFTGH